MHARWIALFAIAAACGGKSIPTPEAPKLGPEVDEKTAEKDARGLVIELYQMAGTGKADNLMSLLSDPLIVFGPRKLDATATRGDALVALAKVVDASGAKQHAVKSGSLEVVPAQGGRSAWAVDVISVDGSPLAITAVMTNNDDLWVIDAASLARTPLKATVKLELKKEAVVPPGMAAAAKADPRATGAIDKFQRGVADQASWGVDLETRDMPVVVGPSAGDVTRGKQDVKKLWAKRLKSNMRAVVVGEVTASVTPDGQLAWVTAPVTRVSDDEEATPLRVFSVYEKDGAEWRLTALHESLAIAEPGAGAAFTKIAPQPLPKVEPKPDETLATATKKKDKDKKDKKKSVEPEDKKVAKKKPVDDEDAEPKKVVKSKKPVDEEAEPVKKKKPVVADDDEPVKKKKKPVVEEDEPKKVAKKPVEEEEPVKKKKKKPVVEEDEPKRVAKKPVEEDDEPVKKKKKKKPVVEEDEDEPVKKKKKPEVVVEDDEDDAPKKKKKSDDEDVVVEDDE